MAGAATDGDVLGARGAPGALGQPTERHGPGLTATLLFHHNVGESRDS